MTTHLMTTVWLLAAHSHGHGSGSSGLVGVFLRSIVRSFAWHTVSGIFHAFGPVAVVVGVIAAVVVWVRYRRSTRGGRR